MATVAELVTINRIFQTILQNLLFHPLPVPTEVVELTARGADKQGPTEVPDLAVQWLGLLNLAVSPHALRTYVLAQKCGEADALALIRFLVGRSAHTQEDRDKVDWLATHFFKLRETRTGVPTAWPKPDLIEMLAGLEFPGLSRQAEELLMEMPALLDEVKFFRDFSQITDSHIIQRARDLKNQFGEEFFHPDVLSAVVNYNLMFGRRFHDLFQDSIRQVQEFAKSDPNTKAPDEKKLLASDYRLTGEAFSSIGNLSRKEGAEQEAHAEESGKAQSSELQLKQLGVDAEQETLYLKNRIEELLMRVRGNPGISTIPNSFAPLMLDEWEVAAMRSPYPETEQSFRADFSRAITRAIAIVYRVYEEIPQFLEKKGTEFLWKRHYDSLVYLLYEGRNQKETLLQLSSSAAGRGLNEKAKQLGQTAGKLDIGLAKVAELF